MSADQIEVWKQKLQDLMTEIEDTNNKDYSCVLDSLEQVVDELDSLQ